MRAKTSVKWPLTDSLTHDIVMVIEEMLVKDVAHRQTNPGVRSCSVRQPPSSAGGSTPGSCLDRHHRSLKRSDKLGDVPDHPGILLVGRDAFHDGAADDDAVGHL